MSDYFGEVRFNRLFDIYGNERQKAWKKILFDYDGKPPDSGLVYPDASWWARPDLLTGHEYDRLMMWLTEPTIGKTLNAARIVVFREIEVYSSRFVCVPREWSEKYAEVVDEYEPKLFGERYVSLDEFSGNMKIKPPWGRFYNLGKDSTFEFRRNNVKFGAIPNRYVLWTERGWFDIPVELYSCLTVEDHTIEELEAVKRKVCLDTDMSELIELYEKLIDERKE